MRGGCGPRTCWWVISTRPTTCRTQITANGPTGGPREDQRRGSRAERLSVFLCLQIVTILDPILFRSGTGLRDINTD
jgi:hypothetical protein